MTGKSKYHLLILFWLGTVQLFAQDKWTLLNEYPVEIDDFFVDNLGYIYLLDNNELVKMNKEGDTLFQFSDMLAGNISTIDVSNTLRPVIFCRENSELIITDNTLSNQNGIHNLSDINLYRASLVASSSIDKGIWIYDEELFQLIKINKLFERIYESGNLEQLLAKENLLPIQLQEFNAKVYMLSPENGILVFDTYGTYVKTIPIIGADEMQVIETGILYQKEGAYYKFDSMTLESYKVNLPTTTFRKVLLNRDTLFIWTKNKLAIYTSKGAGVDK